MAFSVLQAPVGSAPLVSPHSIGEICPRPMRGVVRRKLIQSAIDKSENEAAASIATALDQRFKALKRDLRRANLRKRLVKADGSLSKALSISWPEWIAAFIVLLRQSFTPIISRMLTIEQNYWLNRGGGVGVIESNDVLNAYEARVGRQISNIADDTKNAVLSEITDWYNDPSQSFGDLLTSLGQWFSPERAKTIARTETAGIASQVTLSAMQQRGIKQFNVDLAPEENGYPCQACIDQAAANPHTVGDEVPPFHVNCRCGMSYVMTYLTEGESE